MYSIIAWLELGTDRTKRILLLYFVSNCYVRLCNELLLYGGKKYWSWFVAPRASFYFRREPTRKKINITESSDSDRWIWQISAEIHVSHWE